MSEALTLHYEDLVRYVRGRFAGAGPSVARDVVHDVCVELLERPPEVELRTPLAFFRRVCLHRAIDRQRADAARSALIDTVEETPDTQLHLQDGASALDFEQQCRALVAVVNELPARARQCFLLHSVYDMTHADIASEIGITRSMVTQHLKKALARIERDWWPAREYL